MSLRTLTDRCNTHSQKSQCKIRDFDRVYLGSAGEDILGVRRKDVQATLTPLAKRSRQLVTSCDHMDEKGLCDLRRYNPRQSGLDSDRSANHGRGSGHDNESVAQGVSTSRYP